MTVQVQTVTGPISSAELGTTLTHEHILVDARSAWRRPDPEDLERVRIALAPVAIENLGAIRVDPYLSLDNMLLDDVALAAREVSHFAAAGGRTIVEQTPEGLGRDPHGLRRVAELTGVQIIMGAGFYLERAHPEHIAGWGVEEVHEHIVGDVTEGVDGVRAGVIGEIAIGPEPLESEHRVLRGAVRAQRDTGVPLEIHLPAWGRRAHEAMDIVEEEGGDPARTVLCHMNPSGDDLDYQRSVLARGAFIQYDMVGQELFFPGEGQCSSDVDDARWIAHLCDLGYRDQLLLSSDVFTKNMLKTFGGYGYDHVPRVFRQRLADFGVDDAMFEHLTVANPRRLFEGADR